MAGMGARLGAICREAREQARLRQIDISTAADVSEATISTFERGVTGWPRHTDEIVAAYERLAGLPDGELWRRAVMGR